MDNTLGKGGIMSDDEHKDIDYRLPDMSGSKKYAISESEHEKVKSKILSYDPKCDWCGGKNWSVSGSVYTNVVFDIIGDRHINNKVHPYFLVHCHDCGNTKQFCMKQFGLATRGGVKK